MSTHVENLPVKIGVVWAAYGVTSWQDVAGFLAALLSALALCEWLWKKAVRPLLVYFGYMKPKPPRRLVVEEDDE